jgi:CBS domain-containing protein
MDRLVGEVMHHGVLTCSRETPIQDVARIMSEHNVSALVVVNDEGHLIGLLSRTDLVNARLYEQYWKHWRGLTAGHVMITDVVSVQKDASMQEASKLMMERHIRRMVVVEAAGEGQKPIGIFSLTDVVRDIARDED